MGRRRRKIIRVVKRTLPKIFICPSCGQTTVRAWYDKQEVKGWRLVNSEGTIIEQTTDLGTVEEWRQGGKGNVVEATWERDVVKVACGSAECDFKYEHPYERKPELIDIYNLAVDSAYRGELRPASKAQMPVGS